MGTAFRPRSRGGELSLSDIQFFKCRYPLSATLWSCFSDCTARLNLANALAYNSDIFFYGDYGVLRAQHLTVNQCNTLASDGGSDSSLYLTNSLLVAVTNWGNMAYTTNTTVFLPTDPGGIFQTVGAGNHYLADGTYRNAGTTNISTNLLASLAKKTTYPPTVFSNLTLSTNLTLSPQATRDSDTPDIGYHYDPLDYIADVFAITNATLTVTGGVAIASYNGAGIWLQDNSALVSTGTPNSPNYFVRYQSVQEQAIALDGSSPASAIAVYPYHYGSTGPDATFRFTKFASPANGGYHLFHSLSAGSYDSLAVQDCELWNGQNTFRGPASPVAASVTLRNNLFHRSLITTLLAASANFTLSFSNNLVYGTTVTLRQPTGVAWQAHDNAFDSCTISTSSSISNSHNAFISCTNNFSGSSGGDIVSTNAIGYQTGPLGNFYQPTTSPLINAGSVTADLTTLYHFTTQTNQTKETNSTVDIGLHYVALATDGLPADTDGEGLSDYFEDSNGNGLFDGNEVYNWTNAYTLTNGLNDLQNYQLTFNVLVNDPAQDLGNEQNTQSETTMVAFGNNILSAFVDSNLGVAGYGQKSSGCSQPCTPPAAIPQFIGWAVSRDGGITFTDKGSVPLFTNVADGVTNVYGNAGDPVLARDAVTGTIYLCGNPKRPSIYYPDGTNNPGKLYFPFWHSTNNGDSFSAPVNVMSGITPTSAGDFADKPTLTVDNFPGQGQGNLYLAFTWNKNVGSTSLLVYRSASGGVSWTQATDITLTGAVPEGPTLVVSPNHEVYLAFQAEALSYTYAYLTKSVDLGTNFTTPAIFLTNSSPSPELALTRTKDSPANDSFRSQILPTLAANPATNGNLYFVYHDRPPTGTNDKANIYFLQSTNSGTNWSAPIQVNNVSTNDQWQPVITVKPDGTKIFIAWYDRRNDSLSNSLIEVYGVIGNLPVTGTNSFATNFVISTTNFPPVFTGTNTVDGMFDPAYPPYFPPTDSRCCQSFRGLYGGHMGDYDTAVSDEQYFYYSWGDNRDRSTNAASVIRNEANVRLIKVSWP